MIGILELPAHLAGCITGRASEVAQPWGTWVVVQHCSCSSTVSSIEALTLITAVAERTVLAEGIGAAPHLHRKMLTVSRGARGLPSVLGLLGCLSAPSGCTHTHHCQLLKDCREQARETARNMVPQVWGSPHIPEPFAVPPRALQERVLAEGVQSLGHSNRSGSGSCPLASESAAVASRWRKYTRDPAALLSSLTTPRRLPHRLRGH